MLKLSSKQNLAKLASTMSGLEKVVTFYYSTNFLFYQYVRNDFDGQVLLVIAGSSVKQFVEACKKATGVDIRIDYLSRRPGDYAEVYSDPSKIRRELNWIARYSLEESLGIAWRWQKVHRNGYN